MQTMIDHRAPFGPRGENPVDEALCRRLLDIALENGGDYADLFFEYRASGGFSFTEGILKAASRGVSVGLGVRVLRRGATGYASTEDLSLDAMERAARTASQIAAGGGVSRAVALTSRPLPRRYEVETVSLAEPHREKRSLCERAAAAALRFDHRVVATECSFAEEAREIVIATSDGVFAHDVQPLFRFGARAIAQGRGARREGSSGGGGRTGLAYFLDRTPEWHGEEAAREAVEFLDCRDGPRGDVVVVLGSADCGIILQHAVAQCLEADYVLTRNSAFRELLGRNVTRGFCTLVDDPSLPGARGSINIDDEGVVPQRTMLIEEGRLAGYIHDRRSAHLLGASPTGNGRRESFAMAPMPRCTNTVLLPGPHDPEAILRSVKRGIWVKKLGGGQVDVGTGDFVFSSQASYLIENGRLTAPLATRNILGNGLQMLRDLTMLGSDGSVSDGIWTASKEGQSVPVGVGCPTMKIETLFVS
jgi:TldD protein